MRRLLHSLVLFGTFVVSCGVVMVGQNSRLHNLAKLQKGDILSGFRIANLYSDPNGVIVGIKLFHIPSGAPVFILRMETVPQVQLWIDTPDDSNKGLPHALEHLLESKGTKGRYFKLLKDMRLSRSEAATAEDFNYYSFASGAGLDGFFELFHALLDALYHPDFTDVEAEREFYHFGVTSGTEDHRRLLVEQGSVYDEMQTGQGSYDYYFELNKHALGAHNPFSFYSSGLPDEMRGVSAQDIRRFHATHYRLGRGTGFIFAIDPREDIPAFLSRVSKEFKALPQQPIASSASDEHLPKYPIQPSKNKEIAIYPFPGTNASDPGEVRFSWPVTQINSRIDLKLLQILFHCVGDGEQSLLYKALVDSKTRQIDLGATTVESEPFLANSPHFPAWNLGVSGIPGNRLSIDKIEEIRRLISHTLSEISAYPDGSASLQEFNRLAMSYVAASRRVEKVWIKNAPNFGVRGGGYAWKDYLNVLEMDPSFNRALSRDPMWDAVVGELQSGKNIWRNLIRRLELTSEPYATASAPSPQLLEQFERERQNRIREKIRTLMQQYHTTDEQHALGLFEASESAKGAAIEEVQAKLPRPSFTRHPPLTRDDNLHYRDFKVGRSVSAIATIFRRPPTLDMGLSFDLRNLPRKYYQYLPLLPSSFDSIGLKENGRLVSYSELRSEVQTKLYSLWVGYEFDARSKRADLTFRCSGTNEQEFRNCLHFLRRIMRSNYLDLTNLERLRDIVDQHLSFDDSFTKQGEENWIPNPAYSLLHEDDLLFFALNSQFTWNHWHWRLKWLLHAPARAAEIDGLAAFGASLLKDSSADSARDFAERLRNLKVRGLEGELVDYWRRLLSSIPDSERNQMLSRLTTDVQEDLRSGPTRVINDLKELQQLALKRENLRIDLTLSQETLNHVLPDLSSFVNEVPTSNSSLKETAANSSVEGPVSANVARRYHLQERTFPLHVGLVQNGAVGSDVIFYSHATGYSQLDRDSLLQSLAKNLLSGLGPQSFHMKASEIGLAYSSSLTNDPSEEYTWYYADRSPDIPALINIINSAAAKIPQLKDPFLVDYALRQTFSLPRSMDTFSARGWAMAQDIWNGNTPEKIRRYSQSILQLRNDPHLLSELTTRGFQSICGVLLDPGCKTRQSSSGSVFFFIGSEAALSEVEKRVPLTDLFRIWPSDYWID